MVAKIPKKKNPVGRPRKKSNAGRPPKIDQNIVNKLEEAFLLGCSDLEACFAAGISKQTLYNYQAKNPEFVARKEQLKENPIYLARKSVVESVSDDPNLALKYLERKKKKEFALRTETAIEGELSIIEKMTDEELESELKKLEDK